MIEWFYPPDGVIKSVNQMIEKTKNMKNWQDPNAAVEIAKLK